MAISVSAMTAAMRSPVMLISSSPPKQHAFPIAQEMKCTDFFGSLLKLASKNTAIALRLLLVWPLKL
jgi:hypothetical protein